MPRTVTREQFDEAVEALWTEIEYQNALPHRTEDEADDVPGFLTLLRRYTSKAEIERCDNAAVKQPDGTVQVPEALHALRKLAGIALRGMIYNGVRSRENTELARLKSIILGLPLYVDTPEAKEKSSGTFN